MKEDETERNTADPEMNAIPTYITKINRESKMKPPKKEKKRKTVLIVRKKTKSTLPTIKEDDD